MASGGKRSTTWGEKNKAPVKPKGARDKKTILKESMGLSNWDKLASYIKNEGAEKMVTEMQKLNNKDFLLAYSSLAEFVKPKLQRTTLETDPDNPLVIKVTRK